MKRIIVALLCTGIASLSNAQETESITSACAGGGKKSIAYEWNIYNGALSYTATLTDCKPSGRGSAYNGTISGDGTLEITPGGFDTFITTQEQLSVSGADTGNVVCTTGLQGNYTTATSTFNGTITKNNCTYSVNVSGVDLVELLTQITYP